MMSGLAVGNHVSPDQSRGPQGLCGNSRGRRTGMLVRPTQHLQPLWSITCAFSQQCKPRGLIVRWKGSGHGLLQPSTHPPRIVPRFV